MPTDRRPAGLLRRLMGGAGIDDSPIEQDVLEWLDLVFWEVAAPDLAVQRVSYNAATAFGWRPDAWMADGFWKRFVHADDADRVRRAHHRLLEKPAGPEAELEFRVLTAGGETRWVRGKLRSVRADGVDLVRGAMLDITPRKQAELETEASATRLRAILDAAADAMLVHDLEGRLVDANRAAAAMLGYGVRELVGMALAQIQLDLDEPSVRLRWRDLEPGRTLAFPAEYRRRDGSPFPVEIRLGSTGGTGERRIVVMARDTSDQRVFEQQLRQTQKMEAVGRLAGGVAHDFNNLLTAIKGHAELLIQDSRDDRVARDLGEISKAADRAAVLTRKLLAFSRQQVFAPEVLDLNESVRDAERLLRPLIGEQIEFATEPGTIGRVRADHGQIEQVLVNLVVNARDAMPGGGKLTVRTQNLDVDDEHPFRYPFVRRGHYVSLVVADTGTGMDAATLGRIFEPFFTTKDETRGSGLGLAIAYGIVKQTGGYLIAESQPVRGSTFFVILPRSDAAVEPNRREMQALAAAGDGRVALIAEDEEPVRSLVARVLRKEGYRVIEATSGEEAVARASEFEGRIDIVITDFVMTGMDGGELAEALLATRPGTPVILMSGYNDVLPQLAGRAGGPSILLKPFTPAELSHRVSQVLPA